MSGRKSTASTPQKLANIQVQTSSAGACIPIVWGTARVACNLIGYYDFQAIAQKSQASGKGGGSTTTGYDYRATVLMAVCEGPVDDIPRTWQGQTQTLLTPLSSLASLMNATTVSAMFQAIKALPYATGYAKMLGGSGQSPWSYMQSKHPDQALSYSNTAYVGATNYDLGSGASLPNNNFEVVSHIRVPGLPDANPKDVLVDFLTNPLYGVPGWDASHIGDLTQYSIYCLANNLLISPALDTQTTASQFVQDIADATNSLVVWSEGKLKMVPRGDAAATGNGVTYTPNTTVLYSLTDDHFLTDGGQQPVRLIRSRPADAYNRFPVEFLDRSNNYNIDVIEARDTGSIYLYGHRKASPKQLHMICNAATAMQVAQIEMQRQLYVRNTYQFDLPWNFALLEAGDIVELTDTKLGMQADPVMITEVEENSDGMLTFTAEEWPFGVNSQVLYPTQSRNGYVPNLNAPAGNINAPVIFEAPDILTTSGLEIWMAVNGSGNWGGCDVYVSEDNATYKKIGTINGAARSGILTAALGAGSDPDTANNLAVDISQMGGQLLSGTQKDADQFNTLCYVDGELVSYENATLIGTGLYNLTYLRRGGYGTGIVSHPAGSKFARLDEAIFKYSFTEDDIGKSLYLKFVSFNSTGGGVQDLANVQPYQYKIIGSALASPLPNVQNLVSVYKDNQIELAWDPVQDFRTVSYEIRKGPNPQTAEIVGRTPAPSFPAIGDGTYWVAAKYNAAYSAQWTEIVISGATLVQNVIATFDEYATGWQGIKSGGCYVDEINNLVLVGAGNFSQIPDVAAVGSVRYFGGVQAAGFYEIPVTHQIDIGQAAPCKLSAVYSMVSASPYKLFSQLPDVAAEQSIIGNYAGYSDVRVQVAISQDGSTWSAWQDFVPGTYVGRVFKFGLALTSTDPTVTALVSGFKFTVDVPDRVESGTNVAIAAGGQSILYSKPFHGGPNGSAMPGPSITILNAQPGDLVNLTQQTLSGFTVQITNNGVGIVRNINWITKAY